MSKQELIEDLKKKRPTTTKEQKLYLKKNWLEVYIRDIFLDGILKGKDFDGIQKDMIDGINMFFPNGNERVEAFKGEKLHQKRGQKTNADADMSVTTMKDTLLYYLKKNRELVKVHEEIIDAMADSRKQETEEYQKLVSKLREAKESNENKMKIVDTEFVKLNKINNEQVEIDVLIDFAENKPLKLDLNNNSAINNGNFDNLINNLLNNSKGMFSKQTIAEMKNWADVRHDLNVGIAELANKMQEEANKYIKTLDPNAKLTPQVAQNLKAVNNLNMFIAKANNATTLSAQANLWQYDLAQKILDDKTMSNLKGKTVNDMLPDKYIEEFNDMLNDPKFADRVKYYDDRNKNFGSELKGKNITSHIMLKEKLGEKIFLEYEKVESSEFEKGPSDLITGLEDMKKKHAAYEPFKERLEKLQDYEGVFVEYFEALERGDKDNTGELSIATKRFNQKLSEMDTEFIGKFGDRLKMEVMNLRGGEFETSNQELNEVLQTQKLFKEAIEDFKENKINKDFDEKTRKLTELDLKRADAKIESFRQIRGIIAKKEQFKDEYHPMKTEEYKNDLKYFAKQWAKTVKTFSRDSQPAKNIAKILDGCMKDFKNNVEIKEDYIERKFKAIYENCKKYEETHNKTLRGQQGTRMKLVNRMLTEASWVKAGVVNPNSTTCQQVKLAMKLLDAQRMEQAKNDPRYNTREMMQNNYSQDLKDILKSEKFAEYVGGIPKGEMMTELKKPANEAVKSFELANIAPQKEEKVVQNQNKAPEAPVFVGP